MGTDIYLSWDKMTKKEKNQRLTGFDIYSGKVGYLRASIGMENENGYLRMIFPEKFWEGYDDNNEDGYEFDFEKHFGKCQRLGAMYLIGMLTNKPINKYVNKQGKLIKNMLSGFGDHIEMNGNLNFAEGVSFLSSVFDFLRLGYQMQKEGKKPKVYISW